MKPFYNVKNAKCGDVAVIRILAIAFIIAAFGGVGLGFDVYAEKPRKAVPAQTKAAFGSKCERLLITEIDKAENNIHVAIYSITRRNITRALVNASERGVKVEVKYDYKSSDWPSMKEAIGYMKKKGVKCTPIKMKGDYAKMHHKFTVIDQKRVLNGSYNYTTSGTVSNYENLLLIESVDIAELFLAEFKKIKNR